VRPSAPREGWARAGNVLLVVLVTALQVVAPRAGSPGHVPDLLAGLAGAVLGAAAALIGGVALLWRRSRPGGVLVVCVAGYAVNAAVIPGVPPYAGWVALYAAGVYARGARRAGYSVIAGAAALVLVFGACALAYPKTVGELVLLIAVTVTAALLATLVRSRRAQLDALRDRAAALERERESAAARGAAEERLRIARDVHDLVGHALSGIAVLVAEFLAGGKEILDAEVSRGTIRDALSIIRRLWNAGIAHRDVKPSNLLVRDGKVFLIDVAFCQVRPSPWRQVVDLANMMLVLALRTSPELVYQEALGLFQPRGDR
jgi:hypothetical protein